MTGAERLVWQRVRNKKLGYYFRRQHVVDGYILDFYCHETGLCIEIDGAGHEKYHQEYDQARTDRLRDLGIMTIRFTNDQVILDWTACVDRILVISSSRANIRIRDED